MPDHSAPGPSHTAVSRTLRRIALAPLLIWGFMLPARATGFSSIVFYYGGNAPTQALTQFDVAVVEPDHGLIPTLALSRHTRWLAYVSVGEVQPSRPYFHEIPSNWLVGDNATWKSTLVDQSQPGWPEFVVSKIARPLWHAGYRGFFLDTLDSYQLLGRDPKVLEAQRKGLLRVIRALRHAFPRAMLITNRGFELLPDIHKQIDAVAFESLYKGWDQAVGRYVDVSQQDRDWLLAKADGAKAYGLPVIAIDYCPPSDTPCTRDTAPRIREHGIIPYIGDGHLQTVNLGVLPAATDQ